ncbi:TIGR01212 family radical SAM protein [Peptoniphilus sp.]|uniref:TIGR01212 family radical SAM protein n=1 Tax=Peptoniphilus sp. TaxID=1971214 RepID=UPI0039969142
MSRYLSADIYYKRNYHEKVMRLSLSSGLSCPNRDGTLGSTGCIFCSIKGAGEFAANSNLSIKDQIESQIDFLKKKWNAKKYIAYFQSFTNTYGDVSYLRKIFYEAIDYPGVVGLTIATRADCLSDEVLELLVELNEVTDLNIELGLQTVNEKTIEYIRRGYSHKTFDENVRKLINLGIGVTTHVIFGLPGEDERDFMKTIDYVNDLHPLGIKIHSFYIERNSNIYEDYLKGEISTIDMDTYVRSVVNAICRLKRDIVLFRITGDPVKSLLVEPKWCLDKLKVIATINKTLKDLGVPLLKLEEK